MPLDTVRLLDSDFFALATPEEFRAGLALWCKSWQQVPAGSLPDDDRILAHLSGARDRWCDMRDMSLHGWVKCSDGRLYHPGLNALGPLPVVRDIANVALKGFDSSVSSVDRFLSTASRSIKDMKRLYEGKETKRATRNALEVAGYLGAPTSGQMAAATQFLVDVYGGDQHPEDLGDWWEGLTKGKIKED